ncbi:MAG: co-chaperone GroES [Epsilonproteobacteria bacterium]|nr:co-chaperone GroES [Campylobacterota bacterium]|tara:strand:+ start:259 stop:516 length:258 start_codon:yes stop_codon:yes gene_type:complete
MFQKLRPINNNIWVKLVQEDTKTAGGLYIPDSAKQDAQIGLVQAVGQGTQIKAGEKVFFGKYSGTKAGEEYIVLKEEDVLGVIEE